MMADLILQCELNIKHSMLNAFGLPCIPLYVPAVASLKPRFGSTLQSIDNWEYVYLLGYAVSEDASVLEAQVYQSSKEKCLVYIV